MANPDASKKNKVLFGLSNVYVAKQTGDGEFDTPIHIPGAVNMTVDPEGDQEVFYADNMNYYTANSNAGYSLELEIADIPNEIMAWMLGWRIDDNGALVEIADGVPTPFALLFDVQGDKKPRSAVYYNVTATRPSDEWSTTEDSTTVTTKTLPCTAAPMRYKDENIVKSVIEESETNSEIYKTFRSKVYMPDATADDV